MTGQGSRKVCLCAPETDTLHVVKRDGSSEYRKLTVKVRGVCLRRGDIVREPIGRGP